jgi:hypothetical protein
MPIYQYTYIYLIPAYVSSNSPKFEHYTDCQMAVYPLKSVLLQLSTIFTYRYIITLYSPISVIFCRTDFFIIGTDDPNKTTAITAAPAHVTVDDDLFVLAISKESRIAWHSLTIAVRVRVSFAWDAVEVWIWTHTVPGTSTCVRKRRIT